MMETVEVKTFRETMRCDKCNGKMAFTGTVLTVHPAKYPHYCDECQDVVTMDDVYPRIVYREIEP